MHPSRLAVLLLGLVMALTVPLATVGAASSQATTQQAAAQVTTATNTFDNIPIRGTTATGGTFRGLLDINNFRVRDGRLVAVGDLTGTLRNAAGTVIGSVTGRDVVMPLQIGQISSCDILRLRLGPLDLNLLGLVVHLDRVVLDITAEAGPGNLLGNLLCAIAGLLDQGGVQGVLRDLLRAVLGILNL
jgi:hypothetical protein